MILHITIEQDSDVENPADDGCWEFVSFDSKSTLFREPAAAGLGPRDKFGEPTITNIGLQRRIDVGNAFFLSCYRHSGDSWGLRGEVMKDQWDTADIAGILIRKDTKGRWRRMTFDERKQEARAFMVVMNDWLNGNCFWYRLELADDDLFDETYVCIGTDATEESLRAAIAAAQATHGPFSQIELEGSCSWVAEGTAKEFCKLVTIRRPSR